MIKKEVIIRIYVVCLILVLSIATYFVFYEKEPLTCNDGTPYGNCSATESYFCANGTLIQKASICGCSNLTEKNGDDCISKYQTNPINISFNYTLRGKNMQINFTVYKGMDDYLSSLPRYINTDENPNLNDFKLRSLNNEEQRQLLIPFFVGIENLAKDKDDQARIAISLVQNIPFGNSNKTIKFGGIPLDYYRYPYEVLYDNQGICDEKSELLSFLLREMGYANAFLYYPKENHEAIGIKCPTIKGLNNTGYCFVETTGPSIITDYETEYVGIGQLTSVPEIFPIPGNLSFGQENLYEYDDARTLDSIREAARTDGAINIIESFQFNSLKKKYGLQDTSQYTF